MLRGLTYDVIRLQVLVQCCIVVYLSQRDQFILATFPFTQRVEYIIRFEFDPVDGLIGQFLDIDKERNNFYQEIKVARFQLTQAQKIPTNLLRIPLCLRAESNLDR